jgi:hypothetical protein
MMRRFKQIYPNKRYMKKRMKKKEEEEELSKPLQHV